MSESQYTELDLDNLPKAQLPSASDIEIVDDDATPEPTPEPAPAKPAAPLEDDDDAEDTPEADASQERKRLTRSQRLKAQRDALAARLKEAEAEAAALKTKVNSYEVETAEATKTGFEFYLKTIDDQMKGLRSEFDAAFDAGDKGRVFDVQQKMAELAAEKKTIEREKNSFKSPPTKAAAPTQDTQTRPPTASTTPNPLLNEWFNANKEWFNRDPVMTAVARAVDQQVLAEGYTPDDPEFYEEIDKRLRAELPHKFQAKAQPAQQRPQPTILNKATAPAATGKRTVRITSQDRDMADRLGLTIEEYARAKIKREASESNPSGYTEIV